MTLAWVEGQTRNDRCLQSTQFQVATEQLTGLESTLVKIREEKLDSMVVP